ncbi:MAG: SPOR domain-containing protein [Panacagrimonas sp.]
MPQDYVASNRKPASTGPGSLPGWIWLSAGLSMGLVIAAFVYIGRPPEPMPMAQNTVTRPVTPLPRPKIEIEPAKESEFSFYDLLKEQSVDVPRARTPETRPSSPPVVTIPTPPPAMPEPVPVPEKPSPGPAVAGTHVIVVGSFREATNAERQRATLALSGVESRIAKTTRGNGQTLYQVRVGPATSQVQAQARLAQLRIGGIDGRVVSLK